MQSPILPTHPPRRLQRPYSLREAVNQVISNPVGRQASRFEALTRDREGPELVSVISNLITNLEAVEYREKELRQFQYLLTIEDSVGLYGSEWGFDRRIVELA